MNTRMLSMVLVSWSGLAVCVGASAQHSDAEAELVATLLALERAALDRWVAGDPQGYLDLYAPEVTYFDPYRERRVDGSETLSVLFAPQEGAAASAAAPSYELLGAKVQRHGDVAVLTFNVVDSAQSAAESEPATTARWNTTEVYLLIDGEWKIIHSHWSNPAP